MSNKLLIPTWKQRTHETHLRHLKLYANKHFPMIFLGDSMMARWLKTGKSYWNKSFRNCANLGVGGDGIQHLLYRLMANDEYPGILDVITTDKVLLMIGTNNLEKSSINHILQGILNIIRIIKEKQPRAEILIYGLLDRTDISLDKIANLNTQLEKEITSLNQVRYQFFGDQVNSEDKYFDDNVHLSRLGYEKWYEDILTNVNLD